MDIFIDVDCCAQKNYTPQTQTHKHTYKIPNHFPPHFCAIKPYAVTMNKRWYSNLLKPTSKYWIEKEKTKHENQGDF